MQIECYLRIIQILDQLWNEAYRENDQMVILQNENFQELQIFRLAIAEICFNYFIFESNKQ